MYAPDHFRKTVYNIGDVDYLPIGRESVQDIRLPD